MKLYYDSNGDGTPDTEVLAIVEYPDTDITLNRPSTCVVSLRDFQAGLYSTWEPRDFTRMAVKDDSNNQLFTGYLINKKYTHKKLTLTIVGFGQKLSWTPFNRSYVIEQGQLRNIVDGETITCYNDQDGDRDYDPGADPTEDFEWTVNQWITSNQDKGIIIENPVGLDNELWKCSALDDEGDFDYEYNDHVYTQTYLEGNEYKVIENEGANNETVEFTIDSTWSGAEDTIPIGKFLKKININFNIGYEYSTIPINYGLCALEIWNYDTSGWEEVMKMQYGGGGRQDRDTVGGLDNLSAPLSPVVLEQSSAVELSDYIFDSGGNYNTMKFRIRVYDSWQAGGVNTVWVDYLAVTIEYHADNIGAVMESITDNAASTLTCAGADWDNLGVAEDDGFKIGENSRKIIGDIISKAGLSFVLVDSYSNQFTRDNIYPNGDGTSDWATTGGNRYGELDDDAPIDDDYISTAGHQDTQILTFANINLRGGYCSAISIKTRVKVSADETQVLGVSYSANGGVDWTGAVVGLTTSWNTVTNSWSSLEIYDLNDFQVKLYNTRVNPGTVYCSQLYVTCTIEGSDFDKYSARNFRGSFSIEGLYKICKLEGAYWVEDHKYEIIKIVKPDGFEDTGVDLTTADYEWDWEFEDKCNSVKEYTVFGNAALGIEAISSAGDPDSPIYVQTIDEGINSYDVALKMAEAEITNLATKKPSIKLTVGGVQTDLFAGMDVDITFERPTIAKAAYPIRRITRKKDGISGIKTTLYAGLGQTSWEEKVPNAMLKNAYMAHDAHQARLISTPPGPGANITWSQIGGATGAVENIIIAELVDGQSIDSGIDALILTHKNIAGDHHAKYLDAAAVSALATADVYLKLAGDIMGGDIDMGLNSLKFTRGAGGYLKISHVDTDADNVIIDQITDGSLYIRGFHGIYFSTWDGGLADRMLLSPTALTMSVPIVMASTKVITSADEDLTFTFGRAQIDSRFVDMMTISHRDMSAQDNYAFGQINGGDTYINAPTGKLLHFHINDIMKMQMSAGSLTMSIPIAMGTNKITGLGDPTLAQDATTINYLNTRIFEQSAAFPGAPTEGDFHYDEDLDSLYRYNGEAQAWIEIGASGGISPSIDNLGNHTATQTLNLDNNKITNLTDPTGDQDGATKGWVEGIISDSVASDNLIFSNDAENIKSNMSYTKIKEIIIYTPGNIRIYYQAKTTSDATDSKTKVYINGAPIGAEHINISDTYVAFTDDVTVDRDDLLQIYGYGVDISGPIARNCYVRYMRIKHTNYVSNDP